ncbi:PTS ascorbate transporter subunit IIC [Sporolactobacillus sp. Y61]|uniref:Ascorbate-specific PTS system EIIC component n=1 Tax=Sporolactobacillus sp. Y61 TaxID=3160863 RepID=A0AAU8IDA7_9BACL
MAFILYIINYIFNQAVFVIGLVIIIGTLVQKKSWNQIISSTLKGMIGFLMITTGAQSLGMALLPLQPMLARIFNFSISMPNIEKAQMQSMEGIGTEMALIFAFGFAINILLARFTRFKYVHLSAHVSFFYAGLITALLKFGTDLPTIPLIIIGAVLLGCYMTFTCAYIAPLMKNVKGGKGFTLGHSSSIGILISAGIGKLVGRGSKDLEDLKLPKNLNFLREMTTALTLVMTLLFLVITLIAGPEWVTTHASNGRDIVSFSFLSGLQFGLWITVIITGVRMMLSEIIPAFHGVAEKVIPNATPGLDIPLLFPYYPTSVIVGFLMSLVSGLIGMSILDLIHYPVVVFPALIPTFFTGAITAIFGNSTGGRRGAITGSLLNGFILIFGQAFLLPMIGTYEPVMRILSETDYCFYGPLLGLVLKLMGMI